MNIKLSDEVRWRVDPDLCGDPHTKANLLLQAHFSRLALPIADYATDTRGVLDNMMRLLQATVDLATGSGWMRTAMACLYIMQVCHSARMSRASAVAHGMQWRCALRRSC
jgi:activating signal cointegrator complex subunit 3